MASRSRTSPDPGSEFDEFPHFGQGLLVEAGEADELPEGENPEEVLPDLVVHPQGSETYLLGCGFGLFSPGPRGGNGERRVVDGL